MCNNKEDKQQAEYIDKANSSNVLVFIKIITGALMLTAVSIITDIVTKN